MAHNSTFPHDHRTASMALPNNKPPCRTFAPKVHYRRGDSQQSTLGTSGESIHSSGGFLSLGYDDLVFVSWPRPRQANLSTLRTYRALKTVPDIIMELLSAVPSPSSQLVTRFADRYIAKDGRTGVVVEQVHNGDPFVSNPRVVHKRPSYGASRP